MRLFLVCNYDIDKVSVKMSAFHRQAFLSWSLIYFIQPHKYLIWNNKDILYKHKSLFMEYWFNNSIVLVDQLFNRNGLLFTYEEFLSEYNIPVIPGDYAKVFGAIPSGVYMLFKSQTRVTAQQLPLLFQSDTSIGKMSFSSHSITDL